MDIRQGMEVELKKALSPLGNQGLEFSLPFQVHPFLQKGPREQKTGENLIPKAYCEKQRTMSRNRLGGHVRICRRPQFK
jgi:hypothetical protein